MRGWTRGRLYIRMCHVSHGPASLSGASANLLTACMAVDVRAQRVQIELEVPGHRLEVAGADLLGAVVRDDQRELRVGLVDALEAPPNGNVSQRRHLRTVR